MTYHSFLVIYRHSSTVGRERELAYFIVHLFLLQLLLGFAYLCNLRVCIHDAGYGVVIHMRMSSKQAFHTSYSIVLGFVGKHRAGNTITNCKDTINVGLKVIVDQNSAPFRFYAYTI